MGRSNEKGTTRNRYAKIQPLFNRTNRLEARNPFDNNHAQWCNELGANSYALQLHNDIGSLAVATNRVKNDNPVLVPLIKSLTRYENGVTKQQENDKIRSSKISAPSLDQPIFSPGTITGETVKKQKKHKHRNKERFYYATLLDFKTELLDIINCIFYIMWCPVAFFARLILTVLTWPAYALFNLFKWIVRREEKAMHKNDFRGSRDIKPKEEQASDLNKCFTNPNNDFDISAVLKAKEEKDKIGVMQTKDRKGRKESQSSRRNLIPPLKLVDDTRRTRRKYFQYSSRHQDVSSVELSSDCQSDEPLSRFFESKDCRKKTTRQFQDCVSLAGKKTFLSTLRHSSVEPKRNHTEIRMKSQELTGAKNLKNVDLSHATDDQITDLKNQLINRYSSMARAEKLDLCRSSAVPSQPIDLRMKSIAIARLPLKPTSLKESVFRDENGVKKLDFIFESTKVPEAENPGLKLNDQVAKEVDSCSDPQSEGNLGSFEGCLKKVPKMQTASRPEEPEKDVQLSAVVPENLEKEKVRTGSGDRPTMSKTAFAKTAEFTNPIDAKSKWLEMKKKFYGKDYVVAVKEEPEKIEARNLSQIASSSKLPAHKIFQYNMLVGRARQMGAEPPPPEETELKKTATSSCLTATEDGTKWPNDTRIESVAATPRCLSQTRSLSQWPESSFPFRTKELKPRPKPRTKGGFSLDRILADNHVSAIDHLTCSSTDFQIPSKNHSGDSMSRMGRKSVRLEQKSIEKLVHLSDEEDPRSLIDKGAPLPIHLSSHNRTAPLQLPKMVKNAVNINSLCGQYTEKIDSLICF